jgi:TolB-like protein/DNA-binding winged helix-turn-helix (wHTH) protein/Flp pilus assembly protein TadD
MGNPESVAEDLRSARYRVDDLVIDIGQQRIWRGDAEIELPRLSFRFLVALIERAPNVVSFDALMDRIWSGVIVSPETLTQRVRLLRVALGDDPNAPRYVAAVHGRGYRLLSAVEKLEATNGIVATSPPEVAGATSVNRWRIAAVVGAFILLTGGLAVHLLARKSAEAGGPPVSPSPATSIAVLPFTNLSGDPESDYFSDGLTEELLNMLTLAPELHVAARTSSFRFKERKEDVKSIGRALGVRHVLEGTVRQQGNRVRITAQLVNAEDGYRLWSRSFERDVADQWAVQDEIALAVADNLKLTLVGRNIITSSQRLTRNPEALDLYRRGKYLYQSWNLERIRKGIEHFQEAIRLDPGFAAAYVSQADALFAQAQANLECCGPTGQWIVPRRELLRRAIDLDPSNADAIASMGLDLMFARDFAGAERELHRAEEMNPNGELVLRNLNFYYQSVGWPADRAIDYAQHLFRLDPLNPSAAVNLSAAYYHAHQYEKALAVTDTVMELDPNNWFGQWMRSASLADLGRYPEAIVAAEKTLELSGGYADAYSDLVVAYAGAGKLDEARAIFDRVDDPAHRPRWRSAFRAYALAGLGRYDDTIAALEQAYRDNDGFLHEQIHLKIYIPMHDDPRFKDIVRRLQQEKRVQHTRDVNEARELAAAAG